jgi:glycosyltransferase involved in cell wall biosynthesis
MNKIYLVSIIIVTYNAENHIADVLQSLITRIDDNTEVIIVDGLSNDRTLEIIKEYKEYVTVLISEKDEGIYDAMRKGVATASGKFILFLGADDKLLTNMDGLVNILIENSTIYYGDVMLYPSNELYGGKFNTAKLLNRNICHQSIFYPKEVFEDYKFELEYKYLADYVMNLKLWASKKYNFHYLEKTIAMYNVTGLSSTFIDVKYKSGAYNLIYSYFGVRGLLIKLFNPIRNFFKI